MKMFCRLLSVLLLLMSFDALAETQAAKQSRALKYLRSSGMPPTYATSFKAIGVNVYYYDTAAELTSDTPDEGVIGYAIDTDAFYLRTGSSWVGVSTLVSLTGDQGGTFANGTNNMWDLSENSETVRFNLGTSNELTLSSATGVATLLTAFDLSLSGGAGALTLTDSASSVVLNDNDTTALDIGSTGLLNLLRLSTQDNLEKVTVTGTTATTALHVDVGESLFDEGTQLTVPVMALTELRFCGNGPNGVTTTYIGPIVEADYGTDMTFGAAGCDAKDNTTESTAYAPWHSALAFKPVAMHCVSTCGTNDTMTLQLRDDAANVTGMTCNITLTGSAATCTVRDRSPATVAANSAIAVSVVNDIDDNCSAGDVECRVYITY